MPKKVFVSGCYDLLHSGHVEFFAQTRRSVMNAIEKLVARAETPDSQ